MRGVEDNLEGGEDKQSGGSLKPWKEKKRRMGDRDGVGLLPNKKMAEQSWRCIIAEAEDMRVGDPIRVSRAGLRNGGESEELQFRSRLYGLRILQGKNGLTSLFCFSLLLVRFFGVFLGEGSVC
jgi:hypothetical protein